MIRVGVFNGMDCHYEMIGYILAHCQSRDDVCCTVFVTFHGEMGWIDLYQGMFIDSAFKPLECFNHSDFDHIVLLTDDDWKFPFDNVDQTKVVCIDHVHYIRRHDDRSNLRRLSTRFFPKRPYADFVLPTFCIVDEESKRRSLASSSSPNASISIVCIGAAFEDFHSLQHFVEHVQSVFPVNTSSENDSRPLHFHLFHRHPVNLMIGSHQDAGLSVTTHIGSDTQTMITTLQRSDYVMMLNGEHRTQHTISGSCPLAYSCGCRILASEEWKQAYQLQSPLVWHGGHMVLEALDASDGIGLVYTEANDLWRRRDAVLAEFLN